jgi:hypothetical protein
MRTELTRDQHKLGHAFGGLRYLANPDTPKPEYGGGSLRLDISTGTVRWYEYDSRGVRGYDDLGGRVLVSITWEEIRAHAASLSPALIEELREHQRRNVEHARTSRAYPNRHADPEGWNETNRWFHEVRMPEWRALTAEGKALRDRAYPEALSTEPLDLFDLLNLS